MNTHPATDSDLQERLAVTRARAAFYAFLGLHFSTLPDEQFVRRLRNGEFASVLASIQSESAPGEDIHTGATLMSTYLERMHSVETQELVQELGVDRTRLYRGVAKGYGPPPPNEMVWSREASDFGILQVISRAYRDMGMEPSAEVKERLDYIGVEIDFMRELAEREAAAWEAGDEEAARKLADAQKAFLDKHLGNWVPDFIEKALEHAETDFYKGHLIMLRGFLQEEKQGFDLAV